MLNNLAIPHFPFNVIDLTHPICFKSPSWDASCGFSAAGPQIAHDMLIGGILSKQCLSRLSVNQVIGIGFLGIAIGIANLLAIWSIHSQSAIWFFTTTAGLYLFSSFLFAGGSFIASNALEDKASAAAMMSFVNMCFATIAVILMGYLANNPLLGFITILSLIWLLVVSLIFIINKWRQNRYTLKNAQ